MKRFASLLIALLMALSVLLTACQQKEPEVTVESTQEEKPRDMTGSAIPQGGNQ